MRSEWNELLKRSRSRSITQTWEWLYTWWKIYGEERELFILVGHDDGEMIGIAPLSFTREPRKYLNLFKYRTICYLGSGKTSERNVISDYLNLIIAPEREEAFIESLLKWLSNLSTWDEIILENVSCESAVCRVLEIEAQKYGSNFEITRRTPSILIKLPKTWDDFLKSIDRNLRYKIIRGRKELAKYNGSYHLIQDRRELEKAFEDLEKLHQTRWEGKGIKGAFSSPAWKEFHRLLMPLLFENGWLKLSFLKIEGIPIAANYNFAYDKKIHYFQSGILPHENSHLRPGLLLHSCCIEEAIREGFEEYDFLQIGSRGPGYKEMWGNYSRDLLEIRIAKPSKKESWRRLLTHCLTLVRKMKDHVMPRITLR